MNRDSKGKYEELQPGEVIYTSPPAKKSEPARQPPPKPAPPKPKAPSFDIPLDKKRKIDLKANTSQLPQRRSVKDVATPQAPSLKELERPIKSTVGLQPTSEPPAAEPAKKVQPDTQPVPPKAALPQLWPTPNLPTTPSTPSPPSGQAERSAPPLPLPISPQSLGPPQPPPADLGQLPPSPVPPPTASNALPAAAPPMVSTPAPTPDVLAPSLETPAASDKPAAAPPAKKKSYVVFTIVTFLIIVGTLIGAIVLFWPRLENILQSSRNQQAGQFESVLFNSLQVGNQVIDIEIEDRLTAEFLPSLSGRSIQADQVLATVDINDLSVQHSPDFFHPQVAATFKFDLTLTNNSEQTNLSFDVTTVFTDDDRAYFKLDNFCINGCNNVRLDSRYTQRWSDLRALLQSGHQEALLPDNQSIILNYVANLLRSYPPHQYLVLWPFFNVKDARQYQQVSRLLRESQAYQLDTDSCSTSESNRVICRVTIDYGNLLEFYGRLYSEVFEKDLPSYYHVLERGQQDPVLPNRLELTFNTEDNLPTEISFIDLAEDDNSGLVKLHIHYSNFDDLNFQLRQAGEPLSLVEYHRQLLEAEEQLFVNI